MTMRIIILVLILFSLTNCGQAGWIGYYSIKKSDGSENKIKNNTDNGIVIKLPKQEEFWIELPRDCSGFKFAGILTPFTPPIPLPIFRSWSSEGKNGDGLCHYFIVQTRPQANIKLKTNNQTYNPKISKGLYGYTKYIFPVRAKNIDSGSIIIEKDGEKIEVPFEYKYMKFWY